MEKDRLVDAEDGSRITGLAPATLRKMAWQRRIRSFKVLKKLLFRREDLERLVVERPPIDEEGA